MNRTVFFRAFLFAGMCSLESGAAESGKGLLEFNRDIRPILSEHCFSCHGLDAKKRKADLRLDTPQGAYTALSEGQPIRPGEPDKSTVWQRIQSSDPEQVMPPPDSHKKLSPSQKEVLRRWIAEGASYQKHWAFEPLARRDIQGAAGLSVSGSGSTRPAPNPVDSFLERHLAAQGLGFSREASRETLIRRVAFTLTGLPPTIAEVDAYLGDTEPGAYERLLDRYLGSPRYGEEMARHWLDMARYADTHGLHLDNERHMWAYRDWVIEAFNRNLPYDQFTLHQLAGDLLPGATAEQITATGFNRCNVTTSEGGAIAEEYRHLYAVDRAATVLQTWMGLTAACAQCHDHKYDPLSTAEFYSIYAFFFSAADPPMDGNIAATPPYEPLHTRPQRVALQSARHAERAAVDALEEAALQSIAPSATEDAGSPGKRETVVRQGIFDETLPFGAETRNTSRNPTQWETDPVCGAHSGRRVLKQISAQYLEDTISLGVSPLIVPTAGTFEVWVWIDPESPPRGISIGIQGKRVFWGELESLEGSSRPLNGKEVDMGILPRTGMWNRLSFPLSALDLKPGSRIETCSVQQAGGFVRWDAATIHGEIPLPVDRERAFEQWRSGAPKKSASALPPGVLEGLGTPSPAALPEATLQKLRSFYIAWIDPAPSPRIAVLRDAWNRAKAELLSAEESIEGTLVYRDLPDALETFVALRGEYNKRGERVEPAVPAAFHPLRKADPSGRATRLDLARWIIAPENPLTARVAVNRFWQQVFGTGLVKTSHDFGSQGEPPSHPDLLDWLAVHFRESGWDVKGLMRLMLRSRAFRQDAGCTPDLIEHDAENRMLARGPRVRLDAEQIRDNVLSVSTLLNLQTGGRGVFPYQPAGIWEPVGYANSNTRFYLQDHGEALYRRSIYCFLKRTAPPPFMSNFDAPNREQSCSRRERTNTPLQALQLLNDTQHFEAARALAERVLAEGGASDATRITWMFRSVLARKPEPAEEKIFREELASQRGLYQKHPDAAMRAIRTGESRPKGVSSLSETAAWTMLANLILNLDETITRN